MKVRVAKLLLPVLLAALLPCPRAAAQPASPCSAPEHRQFDFWIGEWEVMTQDGAVAGTNRIESVAGGCGLLESWRGARGSTGTSVNFWSPQDRRWRQTWVGAGGSFLSLEGGLVDGAMVLAGTTRDTTGAVQYERISWTPLPDGRVRQHWQQSPDGKTWTDAFVGLYRRRAKSE